MAVLLHRAIRDHHLREEFKATGSVYINQDSFHVPRLLRLASLPADTLVNKLVRWGSRSETSYMLSSGLKGKDSIEANCLVDSLTKQLGLPGSDGVSIDEVLARQGCGALNILIRQGFVAEVSAGLYTLTEKGLRHCRCCAKVGEQKRVSQLLDSSCEPYKMTILELMGLLQQQEWKLERWRDRAPPEPLQPGAGQRRWHWNGK